MRTRLPLPSWEGVGGRGHVVSGTTGETTQAPPPPPNPLPPGEAESLNFFLPLTAPSAPPDPCYA
jgi:hypothetical protein